MAAFIIARYNTPLKIGLWFRPLACSKLKFKCQLDRAWSTNLVQRVIPSKSSTRAEAVIQHLCGLAEEGIGKDVIKRPEIRVIENVEEFASGLKPQTLGERELPSQSEIHLGYTESTQCVPAQVSLLTGGGGVWKPRGFRRMPPATVGSLK